VSGHCVSDKYVLRHKLDVCCKDRGKELDEQRGGKGKWQTENKGLKVCDDGT
jgi:hypothetical protein